MRQSCRYAGCFNSRENARMQYMISANHVVAAYCSTSLWPFSQGCTFVACTKRQRRRFVQKRQKEPGSFRIPAFSGRGDRLEPATFRSRTVALENVLYLFIVRFIPSSSNTYTQLALTARRPSPTRSHSSARSSATDNAS